MLPFLHKYITATPSVTSSTKRSSSSKRRHKHRSSKKRKRTSSSNSKSTNNNNNDNNIPKIEHKQSESKQQSQSNTKPSITISSDTVHSNNFDTIGSNHSSNSHSNSIHSRFDEHKYNELPSTSESKVIFIETATNDKENDNDKQTEPPKSAKPSKKRRSKTKSMKYWTVSIASKHNEIIHESSNTKTKIVMGFGVCDVSQSSALKETDNEDEEDNNDLDTAQLLKSSNYGYGYCVTYSDNIKYQSYHTKLKSLDDILISFNSKTNKLTLWQNVWIWYKIIW